MLFVCFRNSIFCSSKQSSVESKVLAANSTFQLKKRSSDCTDTSYNSSLDGPLDAFTNFGSFAQFFCLNFSTTTTQIIELTFYSVH